MRVCERVMLSYVLTNSTVTGGDVRCSACFCYRFCVVEEIRSAFRLNQPVCVCMFVNFDVIFPRHFFLFCIEIPFLMIFVLFLCVLVD